MYSSDDEVYTDIFFFNDTATTEIYTLSLHDALPIYLLTFDTGTFYNFALAGNLQPFEELKVLIEEAIEEKRILSKKKEVNDEEVSVVVVAGVAAELNRNEKFDECVKVEEW